MIKVIAIATDTFYTMVSMYKSYALTQTVLRKYFAK